MIFQYLKYAVFISLDFSFFLITKSSNNRKIKKIKKISNKLLKKSFPSKFSWRRKFASLDSVRGVKGARERR